MITLGDEDAFREWLRKTCQMKRQDHFENCYEHLQSLLKDPVIRKMVQDRKGPRVFSQSTTPTKETQRLVLQNREQYYNTNSYFDLQEISGIEPMCACRLRARWSGKIANWLSDAKNIHIFRYGSVNYAISVIFNRTIEI